MLEKIIEDVTGVLDQNKGLVWYESTFNYLLVAKKYLSDIDKVLYSQEVKVPLFNNKGFHLFVVKGVF